jgi:flagellum-specific peptidoglycan hydrolase FlgJ
MFKKICSLLIVIFIFSCGTNRNVVQTKKKPTYTKTVVKKPIENKPKGVVYKEPEIVKEKPVVVTKTIANGETVILEATSKVRVTNEMIVDYILNFKEIAIQDMMNYGVPASITLAQGILESGAGTGALSVQANNHFGIKCHKEWTGPSVRYDDDTIGECFRKYELAYESYRDHSLFLSTRPRYEPLFQLSKDDFRSWAKGLRTYGYATDPKYPDKLIGIIKKYNLQQYDVEALGVDFSPTSKKEEVIIAAKMDNDSLHRVSAGDTLYSISKKYNTSVNELIRLNNLTQYTLSVGQQLKVK